MRRLYRLILVLAAGLIGGLVLYAATRDLATNAGENGAALWSWFLIFACVYAAHRLLPRDDLSHVSRILQAILASAAAVMLCTWAFVSIVDFPTDDGGVGQVLLAGAVTLAFATIVFCPIYLLRNRLGKFLPVAYIMTAILIPAGWIAVSRPFGDEEMTWIALQAAFFAANGVAAAVAFMLVARRS